MRSRMTRPTGLLVISLLVAATLDAHGVPLRALDGMVVAAASCSFVRLQIPRWRTIFWRRRQPERRPGCLLSTASTIARGIMPVTVPSGFRAPSRPSIRRGQNMAGCPGGSSSRQP